MFTPSPTIALSLLRLVWASFSVTLSVSAVARQCHRRLHYSRPHTSCHTYLPVAESTVTWPEAVLGYTKLELPNKTTKHSYLAPDWLNYYTYCSKTNKLAVLAIVFTVLKLQAVIAETWIIFFVARPLSCLVVIYSIAHSGFVIVIKAKHLAS